MARIKLTVSFATTLVDADNAGDEYDVPGGLPLDVAHNWVETEKAVWVEEPSDEQLESLLEDDAEEEQDSSEKESAEQEEIEEPEPQSEPEEGTCGQYGGYKANGEPCSRPAGWGVEGEDTGLCANHRPE